MSEEATEATTVSIPTGFAEELDRLARLSSPDKLAAFRSPNLGRLADSRQQSIQDLVADAVESMPSDRYAAAARALLVDPETRTENWSSRSRLAATEFAVAFDTFRRNGADGSSPREKVIAAVAVAVEGLESPDAPQPSSATESEEPPRRRLLVAVAIAALVTFGGLAAIRPWQDPVVTPPQVALGELDVSLHCTSAHGDSWVAVPSGSDWLCRAPFGTETKAADLEAACRSQYGQRATAVTAGDDSASWSCATELGDQDASDTCPIAAGRYDPTQPDDFARIAVRFRERYNEAGGSGSLGCPVVLVHRWADGYLQEIRDNDGRRSGLAALRNSDAVLLTGSAWDAFNRIKGFTGGLVGFPLSEPIDADDRSTVELAGGGAIISGLDTSRNYHWMPSVVYERWLGLGGASSCLRFPVSDPYTNGGVFQQDYELGQMTLDPATGVLTVQGESC